MVNPWLKLDFEKPPYILSTDKEIIDRHNKRRKNENYLIRLDNLPTPYFGNFKKATILLLQLNPGSEILPGLEPTENHEFLIYRDLKDVLTKNLRHETMDYPFFWLNPEFLMTGGFKYWARMFSTLIKNKNDYKKIANKVCCVQYFPYHSKNYQHVATRLESQNYSFCLVKEFIKKPNGIVIIMKSPPRWYEAVSELNEFNTIHLINNRAPYLTRNNFKRTEDFNKFVQLLELSNS